jgi:hypothetical protein
MALTPESQKALMDILKVKQPQSIAAPLSPYEAIQADRGLLSTDPVISKLQKLGRGVKSLLEPETPIDYLSMALPVGKTIKKSAEVSFDTFKKLASKGKLQKAKSQEESLKSITKKEVPAQDFEFNDFDEIYESGEFTNKLERAGLYVIDDMIGRVVAGRTKKDAEKLAKAESPIDYGKSYGYSNSDIAQFYVARNQGDYKKAYKDYLKDL